MKTFLSLLLLVVSVNGWSAGSVVALDPANNRLNDVDSLRRGAKLFVQRCSSCHSVKYIRYIDIAKGLNWTEQEIDTEMMINGRAKIHAIMLGGMDDEAAKLAYGNPVPDLSLVAKARSPDWIYTYLRGYYTDSEGKTDNYVFKGVAMPNLLAGEQGQMKPVYQEVNGQQVVVGNQIAERPKSLTEQRAQDKKIAKFNIMIRDIVNFLEFVSEPNKLERQALGVKVILFLLVLFVIFFFLKKEYWRDVKK